VTVSIRLTRRPLSVTAAARELEGPGLGGLAIFAGRVRPDRGPRGTVTALVYDTHRAPAVRRLEAMERVARRRYGARCIVLWHRFGRLQVGEISVIVGAACAHRAPAFAAARYLIEELKATVPIWKTERTTPRRRPS
jgi:molybdopterin synthase catalytic subunit